MSNLIDRFNDVLNEQSFTPLELVGFNSNSNLALLAGMALGYSVAVEDFANSFPKNDGLKESEVLNHEQNR